MKSITRFVDIHSCEYDGKVFRSTENSRTIKMGAPNVMDITFSMMELTKTKKKIIILSFTSFKIGPVLLFLLFHLQMFACPNISRNFYEDHKLFCDVMSFMLYL